MANREHHPDADRILWGTWHVSIHIGCMKIPWEDGAVASDYLCLQHLASNIGPDDRSWRRCSSFEIVKKGWTHARVLPDTTNGKPCMHGANRFCNAMHMTRGAPCSQKGQLHTVRHSISGQFSPQYAHQQSQRSSAVRLSDRQQALKCSIGVFAGQQLLEGVHEAQHRLPSLRPPLKTLAASLHKQQRLIKQATTSEQIVPSMHGHKQDLLARV